MYKIKKEVLDMNKMNYLQYSTAIDVVANMTNVDNEVAIKTVGVHYAKFLIYNQKKVLMILLKH